MAKRPGPFAKPDAATAQPAEKPALTVAALPNDAVSLAKRREARNRLPDFKTVDLVMWYETHNPQKPIFTRDLSALADAYPHHRFLIQQLLVGVRLHFGLKRCAFQSYQSSHLGIENDLAFLNSDEPLPSNPSRTADLSYAIGRLFHAWLIRKHPGRANNRKLYGNLRRAVVALQKKHGGSPGVGPVIEWPPGPRTTEQASQSYSGATLNALVGACLEDIKYVIGKMSSFPAQVRQAAPFVNKDGVLVNVRSSRHCTKSLLTAVESDRQWNRRTPRSLPNFPVRGYKTRTRIISTASEKPTAGAPLICLNWSLNPATVYFNGLSTYP